MTFAIDWLLDQNLDRDLTDKPISTASLITDERAEKLGGQKQLTQAVFDGLPAEYSWAAVDADGVAYAQDSADMRLLEKSWSVPKKLIPLGGGYDATNWQNSLIERQGTTHEITQAVDFVEPVQAVAVENLPEGQRPYSHYFKDVSGVDAIDLYYVAKLYEINDPCLFHAFKKIACAGKRGAKDQAQDVQEAIDALKRWQELNK